MLCQNEILRRRSSRKLLAECFCWSEIGDWLVQSLFSWSARAQCDIGTVHAKTAYLELTDSLRGPQFEARLRQCRTRRRQQQQATPAAEWNVATIAAVWVTSPPLRAPPGKHAHLCGTAYVGEPFTRCPASSISRSTPMGKCHGYNEG